MGAYKEAKHNVASFKHKPNKNTKITNLDTCFQSTDPSFLEFAKMI